MSRPRLPRWAAGGVAVGLASLAACADNPTRPLTFRLETVATGLDVPVQVTAAPGDPTRLFVVEKTGRIHVIRDGTLLQQPFLDLSGSVSVGAEQGLLGLAFAPDYATSGRFYLDYTDPAGATIGGTTRIVRYRVSVQPDSAVPTPDRVLLSVPQPQPNHNGGMLAFGPDGMLYIGLGDGGGANDPDNHAQNKTDLLGKLLRIDVSGPGDYAIPPDNPFSAPDAAEIWCYGLRNPWRFSFDRLTGDLYIGDVGQDRFEEVDVAPAVPRGAGRGLNFGWRVTEGFSCFNPSSGCDTTGLTAPALDYPHAGGTCSVTGGYVHRGAGSPSLYGMYFYADYCAGWVRGFRYAGGKATEQTDWPQLDPGGRITSFGEDTAGELYITTIEGGVYRIAPNP